MNQQPLVSVIVPFLNPGRFIQEAIESVLAQTYDAWEMFLVDDGSTDESAVIAQRYAKQHEGKIRFIENAGRKTVGASEARNVGLRQARGDYVAFLDADDVWLPGKLKRQVEIMNAMPEVGMLYGNTLYWFSWTGKPEDQNRDWMPPLGVPFNTVIRPPRLFPRFLNGTSWTPCTCSLLVRRAVMESVGGFDSSFRGMYDDQALYSKISLRYPIYVTEECHDRYRQHPASCYTIARATGKEFQDRLVYLNWIEQYLTAQGVRDEATWRVVQKEFWPYRRPLLHRLNCAGRWLSNFPRIVIRSMLPKSLRQWLRAQPMLRREEI